MCIRDRYMGRVSHYVLLIAGLGIHILGLIWITFVTEAGSNILTLSILCQGAGIGILYLMQLFLLARYAPVEHRGKYFGASISFFYLGSVITDFVVGYINSNRNVPFIFRFMMGAGILAVIYLIYRDQNKLKQGPSQDHEPILA
eukprot:TRINITY_DN9607_c0_g1_i5.p1 TRINITY_DN9607_c0_g1~~TRINITY_DN9607_c0_g1_i5.p1  ORF type:complete len:164 (+),score=39.88 TRINITY_DN9607_c0_g1_i5:62-493(+)